MKTAMQQAFGAVLMMAASAVAAQQALPALFGTSPQGMQAKSAQVSPTLSALRGDPNVQALRVASARAAEVVAAGGFTFDATDAPGDTVRYEALTVHTSEDGISHLTGPGASLSIQGPDVLGTIEVDGTRWRLTPLGGGQTAIYRYDESRLQMHPPGWTGELPAHLRDEATPVDGKAQAPEPQTGAATVDIMVLYTAAAETRLGNARLAVDRLVTAANRHYRASGLAGVVRLRAVHHGRAPIAAPASVDVGLTSLGRSSAVRALRDEHGADLVHLLIRAGDPTGDGRITCGVAYQPRIGSAGNPAAGLGVTAVQCDDERTFSHEVGHNLAAGHDIANSRGGRNLYAHGRCDPRGWATVMAYVGRGNRCTRSIGYFSNPAIAYQGRPTGIADDEDNARVILETVAQVAAYRAAAAPERYTRTLPWVMPANRADGTHSLVRLGNPGNRTVDVAIAAWDAAGRPGRSASVRLPANGAAQITSAKLESTGHPSLTGTLGDGTGAWRLEMSASQPFEAQGLIRTSNGLLMPVDAVGVEHAGANSQMVHVIPTANPASNRTKQSLLRVSNRGATAAQVAITGYDDTGAKRGPVRVSVGAQATVEFSTLELEEGRSEPGKPALSGRLGDGEGKWRIEVASSAPLAVVSAMKLTTGGGVYWSNLSGLAPTLAQSGEAPPPSGKPDLTVDRLQAASTTVRTNGIVEGTIRVRNNGTAAAPASTLRLYESRDATITRADSEFGTPLPTPTLDAGASRQAEWQLTVGSTAGTFYFGACIDPVADESETGNNCSQGLRITVQAPTPPAGRPDLVVRDGDLYTTGRWRIDISNVGTARSPNTSAGPVRDRGTYVLGTTSVPAMAAGTARSVWGSFTPSAVRRGDIVAFCVVRVAGETNTRNNCRAFRYSTEPKAGKSNMEPLTRSRVQGAEGAIAALRQAAPHNMTTSGWSVMVKEWAASP